MDNHRINKSGLYFPLVLTAIAVCFTFCFISSASESAPRPIIYYDFNENIAATASDLSGNEHHGAIHGARHVTNGTGYALWFAAGDYVDCGGDPDLRFGDSSFTIEAWINWEYLGYPYIINNYDDKHYLLYLKDSRVRLHVDDGENDPEVTSGDFLIQSGLWYHVAAVRDAGKTLRLYVNGEERRCVEDTSGDITSSNPLVIGRSARDGTHEFEGGIDEVRIYDCALSGQTIQNHYQQEKGAFQMENKPLRKAYEPPGEQWDDSRVFITYPGENPQKNGPWTPMQVEKTGDGVAISCWGRRYIFTSASILPTQIVSQGEELLFAPIRLFIGNSSLYNASIIPELPQVTIGPFSGDDEQVTFKTRSEASAITIEADITLEFDGYMWIDVNLTGGQAIADVSLNIPMRPSTARYYNYGESGWSLERAGVVGGDGWGWSSTKGEQGEYVDEAGQWDSTREDTGRGGWEPIVSLCSDRTGLSWFADDYRGWNGGKEISIHHQGDQVFLRAKLVDASAPLPLSFSFGLQAVPLKPMPRWHWSQKRFFCETPVDMFDKVGGGFRTFAHFRNSPHFSYYPHPNDPDFFHKYLADYHERGCKVTHYLSTHYVAEAIADYDPAWEVRPKKQIGPYASGMVSGVCPNSDWRHFWVDSIVKKTFAMYPELDGLYFDCATPMGCERASHGCAPYSFQWRAEREMFKKAYVIVKRQSQDKIIQLHSSGFRWVTPCLSFVDARLSGEYLDHNVDSEDNRYHPKRAQPFFPANEPNLAKFRSCMQPHSWGIPVTFLSFDREAYVDAILTKGVQGSPDVGNGHRFGNPEESAAWCAVHDMTVQTTIADHFRYAGLPHTFAITRDICDILEEFGAGYDSWYGYWQEPPLAEVSGSGTSLVRVSGYVRKGDETLLVIANLSSAKAEARITLNCDVLGLDASQIRIEDVGKGDWIAHEDISYRGNMLSLNLEPVRSVGSLRFLKVTRRESR